MLPEHKKGTPRSCVTERRYGAFWVAGDSLNGVCEETR